MIRKLGHFAKIRKVFVGSFEERAQKSREARNIEKTVLDGIHENFNHIKRSH